MFRWPIMPIKGPYERFDRSSEDCAVGEIKGARARQRLFTDYETCVQHGAKRIHGLVPAGAATWLHQGHRERVAGIAGSARARVVVHHYKDVGDPKAGGRSGGQRPARARIGPRDQPREERQIDRDSRRELVVAAAATDTAERARYLDSSRTARSRHSSRPSRLRTPPIRSGRFDTRACSAARWTLVCCRPRWKARTRPNRTTADLG